jgi:hypothetical protein
MNSSTYADLLSRIANSLDNGTFDELDVRRMWCICAGLVARLSCGDERPAQDANDNIQRVLVRRLNVVSREN